MGTRNFTIGVQGRPEGVHIHRSSLENFQQLIGRDGDSVVVQDESSIHAGKLMLL
jgi:hypothetical protein